MKQRAPDLSDAGTRAAERHLNARASAKSAPMPYLRSRVVDTSPAQGPDIELKRPINYSAQAGAPVGVAGVREPDDEAAAYERARPMTSAMVERDATPAGFEFHPDEE